MKWNKVIEKTALGALFALGTSITAIQASGELDLKKIAISVLIAVIGGAISGAINYIKHKDD